MMAGPYTPPKLDDKPLPELFTLVAQCNPRRPFVQVIREHLDGPIDCILFTWEEVIQHAQNAAEDLRYRWTGGQESEIAKKLFAQPREPGSSPVVAGVLAKNGYELYVNVLACLFNRWTALLISPRNSPAAIEHLLRASNSSLLLVDSPNLALGRTMEQAVAGLCAQLLATLSAPAKGSSSSPLTQLTDEQLKREMRIPALYLHTSGSTSHPKIIPWTHEFVLSAIRARIRDRKELIGRTFYCMPPLIHSMGSIVYFICAIANANLMSFVSTPTPKPPSPASLLAHLPFIKDSIVMVPPSILEDLISLGSEEVRKLAEGTWMVVFGGAPLKQAIGDALVAAGVNLTAGYGSTEINIGSTHLFHKAPENWEYIYFRGGYEWHFLPIDDHSDLRELIVGPGIDSCPAVINHESPLGFATNDVWEPHPTVPDLWKHHSRKGDVTVLGNGEKSDNKQIENLLRDRRILHVLVFGAGRPMNGVIIQPADLAIPAPVFLAQIQPTIEYANSILPKHSRLVPELVIVATPDRLMAKTDKGTIKKEETLDIFRQEIEQMYIALEGGLTGSEWAFEGNLEDEEDLKAFIRNAVRHVLAKDIPDEGDLFEYGLDSLLAMRLRSVIMSVVKRIACEYAPPNVVYTFPTITALTRYLLSCVVHGAYDFKESTEAHIQQLIEHYSAGFVPHVPGYAGSVARGKMVALSGSTGSVGSSLLSFLLEKTDVSKVYLLNRKGVLSQKDRHVMAFNARGLDPRVLDAREESIVYLDIDFSKKDLGLVYNDYEDLRHNVTHIIHAAWHLNFNLILKSYESVHIAGVRHLADLALSSPHPQPPRIIFLSTIAAVGEYRGPSQEPSIGERARQVLVPEVPIDDPAAPFKQGYGQSKYVSERVLENAVQAGLRVTIIRGGQLSGSTTNGAWAAREHVPIMLRSSLALGIVPEDLACVRWVPSDIAASAIAKQAFEDSLDLEYFSIENPFPTPWKVVVEALSAVSPTPLRPTTLTDWLDHIINSNPNPTEVPAIKLLNFYQSLAERQSPTAALGWEKSVKVAPELAVGPITNKLVEKYVVYQLESSRNL